MGCPLSAFRWADSRGRLKMVILVVAALFLAAWLFGGGTTETKHTLGPYPAPWRDGAPKELTRTLALNKISGCGRYRYKPRSGSLSEILVQCMSDGITWTEHLALPTSQKVFGLYPPGGTPR